VGKISSEDGIILSTQYHSSRSLSLDPSRATDRSRSLPSVDGVMLSQVVWVNIVNKASTQYHNQNNRLNDCQLADKT
jgi:hypothetical protein